jgi:hypothetical protein
MDIRGYTDLYGNRCLGTVLPAGRSGLGYRAAAVVPDRAEEVDQDAPECAPDAIDARNNTPRKGRIVIGRGRDASDVAMATTFGGPRLESMLVQVEEDPARAGAR